MESDQSSNKTSKYITIAGAVILLGVVGTAVAAFKQEDESAITTPIRKEDTSDTTNTVPTAPAPTSPTAPAATESGYKDGAYSSTGTYVSPAGQEEVDITLTLQGGVVASAVFVGKATNPGSVKNQGLFKAGFELQVVGKPIDSINLTVVNGSSLTPKGFMDALMKIKAEAKA